MTIVASGEISLGGNATATRSVACELNRSGTAAICMDESAVRSLAERTTAASAICMNDFYGKSAPPTALGQSFGGGYYTGIVYHNCCAYHLIVAPNATGCACCRWKTTTTLTNNCTNATCNSSNGYWNTFTYLNNASHPAGNWTATRSIGGFSDWFLPARNELNVLYLNKASMPTGEGYPSTCFWSSTELTAIYACGWSLYSGAGAIPIKTSTCNLRAVRRPSFTPSTPNTLGQCIYGGFYVGTISSPANYYLIVAPNATGCACCRWKTTNTLTNNCSNATCNCDNGYWNTYTYLNNTTHPAGIWAASRSISGFTDWYMPARNELNVIYLNKASMPAGETHINRYLSSTECTLSQAHLKCLINGLDNTYFKASFADRIRVVRRVPF